VRIVRAREYGRSVQMNICDVLRKRKICCKKDMSHNEGFSNLTVVANVLNQCKREHN